MGELAAQIVLICIFCFLTIQATRIDLPPRAGWHTAPGAAPILVGLLIILLNIMGLYTSLSKKSKSRRLPPKAAKKEALSDNLQGEFQRVTVLFMSMFLYVYILVSLQRFFVPLTSIYLVCLQRYLKASKSLAAIITISVGTTLTMHLFFTILLNSPIKGF